MILDTTTYSALVLGNARVVELLDGETRTVLPLPVVAELRSGFLGGSRLAQNELALAKFLERNTTTVLLPTTETTRVYADLQHYAKAHGRVLSNNDIWIAALAREDGDRLVSFDHDFEVFRTFFGDRLLVLSGTSPVQ